MPAPYSYRGRVITPEDILFLRQFIAEHSQLSRTRLSAKVCAAWDWRQANGTFRDRVCRGLLLRLHRAGEIQLPEVRFVPRNPLVDREQPAPARIDTTPVIARLNELRPVEVQQVRRTGDEPLFNSLIEYHHYLGYERAGGRTSEISGVVAGQAGRLHGLEFGAAASRQPGSFHRLEPASPPTQRPIYRVQHTLPDPALDPGAASCLAHSQPRDGHTVRRLGAHVGAPDLVH
jgi:hypothetical protein